MKKFVLTIIGIAALVGCRHSVTGTLEVKDQLTLNKKGNQTVVLDEGSYKATVHSYDKKDKVVFDIKGLSKKQNVKAEFKIDENMVIPQNGHVSVSSETSGQPWNLEGDIETEMTRGPQVKTYESCRYGSAFWYCYGSGAGRMCGWWYDTYYFGTREVEYHKEVTTRSVDVDFIDPSSQDKVATFDGDKTVNTEIVYDHIGPCL
jgi:hypothetical protein